MPRALSLREHRECRECQIAENAESPENTETTNDAIFFSPVFKILLFSILSESYLTSRQCFQGNIFLGAFPFNSFYAAIPGWSIIAVQHKTKQLQHTMSKPNAGTYV
jgi:hypothetical protein